MGQLERRYKNTPAYIAYSNIDKGKKKVLNKKEKYDYQIRTGFIDAFTFLDIFSTLFCDIDEETGKVLTTPFKKRLKRLTFLIYNNKDFPAVRIGGVFLIDLNGFREWIYKKKKVDSYSDIVLKVKNVE